MKYIGILIMTVLLLTGCSSLRVEVDYDPSYDFSSSQSFAIVHKTKEGENTLFSDRFINALSKDLQAKGYVQVPKEKADLIFVFHTNVENKTDIDTDYRAVGYGRYGYGGTMVATTRTYHYTKGTLIIDALNSKDEKIVWRAVSTDTLTKQETPQEREAYVNALAKESMKTFPSKKVLTQ